MAFKALLASAPVSIHQIVTSSSILAWIRKTFIFVHFTVDSNPACIAEALVSTEAPSTVSMDAGIAQALIHLRVTAGVMGPLGAHTTETVHIIDARCTLATGIGGTLINVNVTSLPCESW